MTTSGHLNALGEFLKARRAELTPAAVGLSGADGRRRVAGLRREEVAVFATISTNCYIRLVQGRITPSASMLSGTRPRPCFPHSSPRPAESHEQRQPRLTAFQIFPSKGGVSSRRPGRLTQLT
ncbi:hypothetical protein [Streptomyces sp. NPDC093984]|uniref:hypothetical protein n=1 Tax=Streptomyces sp. NPDC093984 TaxID=3366052 RepID=UPI00381EA5EF